MSAGARPLVTVYSETNERTGKNLRLPAVFKAPIRPDIVNFVHMNMAKNRRHPYAVSKEAGHQTSAESWGTGRAVARIPRVRWVEPHSSGQGFLMAHVQTRLLTWPEMASPRTWIEEIPRRLVGGGARIQISLCVLMPASQNEKLSRINAWAFCKCAQQGTNREKLGSYIKMVLILSHMDNEVLRLIKPWAEIYVTICFFQAGVNRSYYLSWHGCSLGSKVPRDDGCHLKLDQGIRAVI
ncbi:60S ribosomal protein L4-B [Araneus ventricosus]|uniref:60S ribosomal protein L4-B n=1 Tax=Araneus ventricosus TaxID=182803 RepID=A0A4Y2WGC9_ARAVE|nr:60S ribosomal protein L4-B [Araneus ventricosus]